ncbi:ATP-binding protein [Streptomyces diastaticus]|uniref:ATP-binding protein n=1 Tax=Streptomyces diastaticus TaxID=1956 RepID=UPI0035DB8E58
MRATRSSPPSSGTSAGGSPPAPRAANCCWRSSGDGRKHNAGALVGSHDPHDIGPEDSEVGQVIVGLIPRRFLFRHTDRSLAQRGLQFLGCDPHDEELLSVVTTELSPITVSDEDKAARAGECLHRDLDGRINGMQILIPPDPEAAAHIHSQPIAAAA